MKRALDEKQNDPDKFKIRKSRGAYIKFCGENGQHYYIVDAKQMLKDGIITVLPKYHDKPFISVTTIISECFPKFETEKTIDNVRQNPFSGYGDKTHDEIEKMWDRIKTTASTLGTKMHAFIEESLKPFLLTCKISDLIDPNKKLIPHIHEDVYSTSYEEMLKDDDPLKTDYDYKQSAVFFKWILYELSKVKSQNLSKFVLYDVEWKIYDEDVNISGTIDFVLVNPDNHEEIILIDWKRSKEITTKNPKYKSKHPVTLGLDDCKLNRYSIQLNLYAMIAENKYNAKVLEMYVVNVNLSGCTVYPIKRFTDTIQKLRKFRIDQLEKSN